MKRLARVLKRKKRHKNFYAIKKNKTHTGLNASDRLGENIYNIHNKETTSGITPTNGHCIGQSGTALIMTSTVIKHTLNLTRNEGNVD